MLILLFSDCSTWNNPKTIFYVFCIEVFTWIVSKKSNLRDKYFCKNVCSLLRFIDVVFLCKISIFLNSISCRMIFVILY